MDNSNIMDSRSAFRLTAPPIASEKTLEAYLSSTPQMNVTPPPVKAVKIKNDSINLILLLHFTRFGAMYPIKISPNVATKNFIIGISGRNTVTTALNAPINAEIRSLFVLVTVFENIAAKYSDKISTEKLIRKYTSI